MILFEQIGVNILKRMMDISTSSGLLELKNGKPISSSTNM